MYFCNMNYGLIGRKLGHSYSKIYFDKLFAQLKLDDYHYHLIEISNITNIGVIIEKYQLSGFNVTIPYKQQIIPLLDGISEEAEAIGAVNVVKVQGKQLIGFNTDAPAFEETLKPMLKPYHKEALILGTGGASKAVAYALKHLGINHTFVSRTPNNPNTIGYDEAYERCKNTYLIINTTPVGMFPNTDNTPWKHPELITSQHLCYDVIYNPETTLWMNQCHQYGAIVKNGLDMLYRQAELSWKIFNGK